MSLKCNLSATKSRHFGKHDRDFLEKEIENLEVGGINGQNSGMYMNRSHNESTGFNTYSETSTNSDPNKCSEHYEFVFHLTVGSTIYYYFQSHMQMTDNIKKNIVMHA